MDFSYINWGVVLPDLLDGFKNTIIYCVVSFALALMFGLLLALMSNSQHRWLRGPARIYIEVIRSTPMIAQIFLIYYGVSTILFNLIGSNDYVNGWTAGIASLTINYAAYEAEVFRAGIYSVERGQTEAALSLGLNARQAFRRIVFPQSIPLMIPPFVNDFIYMLKDSAIVSVISGTELTSKLDRWRIAYGSDVIPLFIVVLTLYLVLSLPTSYLARWYERRLRAAL